MGTPSLTFDPATGQMLSPDEVQQNRVNSMVGAAGPQQLPAAVAAPSVGADGTVGAEHDGETHDNIVDHEKAGTMNDFYSNIEALGKKMIELNPQIEQIINQVMGGSPEQTKEKIAAEYAPLQKTVADRPTSPQPGLFQNLFGSPERTGQMRNEAYKEEQAKRADTEGLQQALLEGQTKDLAQRGKWREAMESLFIQKSMGEMSAQQRAREKEDLESMKGKNALQRAVVRARGSLQAAGLNLTGRLALQADKAAQTFALAQLKNFAKWDDTAQEWVFDDSDKKEQYDQAVMGNYWKIASSLRETQGVKKETGGPQSPPKPEAAPKAAAPAPGAPSAAAQRWQNFKSGK
jgi:hypothetical protein